MAQQSLLTIVQNILSSLDSDEVNSISDTTESLQIANIVQNKYYDILSRGDLPENEDLFQLTPSNDTTKPTLMTIPSGTGRINWIKYFDSNPNDSQQVDQFGSFSHGLNTDLTQTQSWTTTSSSTVTIPTSIPTLVTFTVASSSLAITVGQGVVAQSGANNMFGNVTSYSGTTLIFSVTSTLGSGTFSSWTITNSPSNSVPGYKFITRLPFEQFMTMINRFNPADSNVNSYTFTQGGFSFVLYYKNNKQPQYAAVLSNNYVLFDSYDHNFDTTLQQSKTLVFGQTVPTFQLTDTFVPPIDDNQFPLLLNESKSLAFYELKQMPHVKADEEIKRQWSAVQKNKSKSNKPTYFEQLPSMGRVPRTGGYSSSGYGAYKWMRP